VIIGHAAHDVEARFDVVLPGLALVDLFFADPERSVNGLRLLRLEDAPAVR
jgi:hypothetical protein